MKKPLAALLALLLMLQLAPNGFAADTEQADAAAQTAEAVEIGSAQELIDFARNCVTDSYSLGAVFSLTADIDLTGTDFAPVPYFAGTFLGNGHMIIGFAPEVHGSRLGLFRTVAAEGAVRDLQVRGAVAPDGTQTYIGGIAGVNYGRISNCSFEGEVAGVRCVGGVAGANGETGALIDCSFRGGLTGEHSVGGICGENRGVIEGCVNAGDVNTVLITPQGEKSFDLAAFSQDDFLDLADIGGVAGDNIGVINASVNTGAVGFKGTAYNVGGIAGKSSGYVHGCENRGDVIGRRDVGGIVGQLIPYTVWDFSDGRMDELEAQLSALQYLVNSAAGSAEGIDSAVSSAISSVNSSTSAAVDAITELVNRFKENESSLSDRIHIDPETGKITLDDIDLSGLDASALTAALGGLSSASRLLSKKIGSSLSSVAGDLSSISDQTSRVLASMFAALQSLNDGTLIQTEDLSAAETYDHDLGAVDGSVSSGAVTAEVNGGGVVGTVGFEVDFDMEDQLGVSNFVTSKAKESLFAAIRGCTGYGALSVREDCAGGVVGSMDMGCVADCVAACAVTAQGDYVGGVAGSASGTLRGCWARSVLAGEKYIGGVAGQGGSILDCRAWTHIEQGLEYLGAVAGWSEDEIKDNLYVAPSRGGVDGVSLHGQADALSEAEMLALEGVPESFGQLTVTFVAGEKTVAEIVVPFGGSIDALPQVANDGEKYWKWDDFDAGHIYYSQTVTGKYYAPGTALSWGGEPPLLLVEGVFYEGQTLTAVPAASPLEKTLCAYTLLVNDYTETLTVHLRAVEDGVVYLLGEDGTLSRAVTRADGQYLVFELPNGGSFAFGAAESAAVRAPWLIGGGAAAVLAAALLLRRKKRRAAAQASPEAPEP